MSNVPKLRFEEFKDNWKNKKIRDIATIIGGGTPLTSVAEYWDGNILWITPTELKNKKYIEDSERKITSNGLKNSSAKLLPKGTVLLTTRATIGEMSILNREATTNQGFQSIIVGDSLNNEFLYYLQPKIKDYCLKNASGSTFLEISKKNIELLKINIPSLPEQEKIASFLSLYDKKIELQEKKVESLKKYKKGMMQKIFSQELRFKDENGENYPDWEEKKLGDLCIYKNGLTYEDKVCVDGRYDLISLNSISIDGYLKSEHKKVNYATDLLEKGDIVMILSDVAHGYFLGLTGIIPENNKYVLNQRIGLLRCTKEINQYWLHKYINYNQSYFKLHGQGSSQQNLSKGDILKFKVKSPSLPEQEKIASLLSTIDKKIELEEKLLEKLKEYKKGLLQQMFV